MHRIYKRFFKDRKSRYRDLVKAADEQALAIVPGVTLTLGYWIEAEQANGLQSRAEQSFPAP